MKTKKRQVAAPPRPGKAKAPRATSKSEHLLALLCRPKGASMDELVAACGWQKQSIRGWLSGTVGKKLNLKLGSTKNDDGARLYRVAATNE